MKKILIILSFFALTSCTENVRVKHLGGSGLIVIPPDQKFVNVTWKEEQLWIVTKQRPLNDKNRETYFFREKSSWGLIEGIYTIKEQ